MRIEKNKIVQFHYSLKDDGGEELDSSRSRGPAAYLHGAGNLVPGLEEALASRQPGDRFSVCVPPERAYGRRDPDAVRRVPLKHFGDRRTLKPGQPVALHTARGEVQATVVKVGRFNVDVDTNHPLAGRTLNFEVEIVDVRDATREEIAHGHAHGPGGHHHD